MALHWYSFNGIRMSIGVCIVWLQRDMNLLVTPLLVLYPVYKPLALGPKALRLGACKPDIAITGDVITYTYLFRTQHIAGMHAVVAPPFFSEKLL